MFYFSFFFLIFFHFLLDNDLSINLCKSFTVNELRWRGGRAPVTPLVSGSYGGCYAYSYSKGWDIGRGWDISGVTPAQGVRASQCAAC